MKNQNDTIEMVFEKTYNGVLKIILPTDAECSEWFENNIYGDSASSAIYKFRLWLKERAKK